MNINRNRLLPVLLVLAAVAQPVGARAAPEEPLVQAVAGIKKSVVALGTFDRIRGPRARFFATGFVVDINGYIVTNAHVADMLKATRKPDNFRVFYQGKDPRKAYKARIVAVDKLHDLCIVHFDGPAFPVEIGDVKKLKQGQAVAAYGFPLGGRFGLHGAVTHGVVSSIAPGALPVDHASQLTGPRLDVLKKPFNVLQLDLRVLPGNSGSPVFTVGGRKVIGIITGVIGVKTKEKGLKMVTGITYAVPINHVTDLLSKAKEIDSRKKPK